MKKYTVRLKVNAIVKTTIPAANLEDALLSANQQFHGEDPFDAGIIKDSRKVWRTYEGEGLEVLGVQVQ